MPTLSEAAAHLGLSRHSLRKWMRRLQIGPTRHEYDLRYWCIADEDVRRIADARAQMLGAQAQVVRAHQQHQDGPHAVRELPPDLNGWRDFARQHGVPETTVQKAKESGRLPIIPGKWKVGRQRATGALDQAGQRQFLDLWVHLWRTDQQTSPRGVR